MRLPFFFQINSETVQRLNAINTFGRVTRIKSDKTNNFYSTNLEQKRVTTNAPSLNEKIYVVFCCVFVLYRDRPTVLLKTLLVFDADFLHQPLRVTYETNCIKNFHIVNRAVKVFR